MSKTLTCWHADLDLLLLCGMIDSSQTTQFTHSGLVSSQYPWVRDEIRPTVTFLNQLYSSPTAAGSRHQRGQIQTWKCAEQQPLLPPCESGRDKQKINQINRRSWGWGALRTCEGESVITIYKCVSIWRFWDCQVKISVTNPPKEYFHT